MYINLRIRPWVLWWFCLGVVCGVVAVLNIVSRNLTRSQEVIILFIGVMNWVLGGVICWAFGIEIGKPAPSPSRAEEAHVRPEVQWYSASDFLLPGQRKLLPTKYSPKLVSKRFSAFLSNV